MPAAPNTAPKTPHAGRASHIDKHAALVLYDTRTEVAVFDTFSTETHKACSIPGNGK